LWTVPAVLLSLLVSPIHAAPPVDEDTVKAVMVERFTRFIEWPERSDVSDPSRPFVVGVVGRNSFVSVMERIYSKRTIRGKKVVVHRAVSAGDLDGTCDLLYFASADRAALSDVLARVKGKPVLLMGDGPSFAEKGGHIGLYFEEGNIRFDVNVQSVWDSNLKISHLLLKHARIVGGIAK
jgi:hypothetical protein